MDNNIVDPTGGIDTHAIALRWPLVSQDGNTKVERVEVGLRAVPRLMRRSTDPRFDQNVELRHLGNRY